MIQQGINVLLKIDGKPVAGQQNIQFNRTAGTIDITNRINGNWRENIAGLKTWSVSCSGAYVINSDSFSLLEDCFMNNKDVEVVIQLGETQYSGNALITSFPLGSSYNQEFKYTINLLGNGELR